MGRAAEPAVLTISTWLWGDKFDLSDVAKLFAGVKRNLSQPHRCVLVTDDIYRKGIDEIDADVVPIIRDLGLTRIKGCYARLRMFSAEWQDLSGLKPGDRLALIDLDTVITGPLDPLFDRPEPYVIMQGGNSANPCKFNGAMQMLRAGAHPEVWDDFSVEKASKVPFYEFPDDQGFIWHKLPNAAGWKCGADSGVYVFLKPGWPNWSTDLDTMKRDLPDGARVVTFSGRRSPQKYEYLDWVKNNWR